MLPYVQLVFESISVKDLRMYIRPGHGDGAPYIENSWVVCSDDWSSDLSIDTNADANEQVDLSSLERYRFFFNNAYLEKKREHITEERIRFREAAFKGELLQTLNDMRAQWKQRRGAAAGARSTGRSVPGPEPPRAAKTTSEYQKHLGLVRVDFERLDVDQSLCHKCGNAVDEQRRLKKLDDIARAEQRGPVDFGGDFPVCIWCSCKTFKDYGGCAHIPLALHLDCTWRTWDVG